MPRSLISLLVVLLSTVVGSAQSPPSSLLTLDPTAAANAFRAITTYNQRLTEANNCRKQRLRAQRRVALAPVYIGAGVAGGILLYREGQAQQDAGGDGIGYTIGAGVVGGLASGPLINFGSNVRGISAARTCEAEALAKARAIYPHVAVRRD